VREVALRRHRDYADDLRGLHAFRGGRAICEPFYAFRVHATRGKPASQLCIRPQGVTLYDACLFSPLNGRDASETEHARGPAGLVGYERPYGYRRKALTYSRRQGGILRLGRLSWRICVRLELQRFGFR
jgi:hypothetical protein